MILRAAKMADLSTVLSWIASEHELLIWAGPRVRHPANPESAWFDMEASVDNAFCLINDEGVLVGFGQILLRESAVLHVARLIVAPEMRGQGMGRDLCLALMNEGASRHSVEYFTLNVYASNMVAVRLYQSLGFYESTTDKSGAVAMIKLVK